MSSALIDSLKKAYLESSENHEILMILISTLQKEGLSKEAYDLLKEQKKLKTYTLEQKLFAAEICFQQHDIDQSLFFCKDNTLPESYLLQSKIYLNLNQAQESLNFYNLAIKANASLEDLALFGQIQAIISSPKISNVATSNVIKLAAVNSPGEYQSLSYKESIEPQNITFKGVGGLDNIKNQIHKKIILPFIKPSIFERFRKKAGGGVLMYGPPGCGKTLLARATAGECKAKFYNIEIADVLNMYIGEAEKRLQEIFEIARSNTPAIIFFDEIEALAGKRSSSSTQNSAQVVSQFLSELDGFSKKNEGILVLGATNTPWHIDSAFRRPGRFDRVLFIAPPDYEARLSILKILISDRPTEEKLDIITYAQKTTGFSGADLSNLIETACDYAIEDSLMYSKEVPISNQHLEKALNTVTPTVLEWLTTAKNYAKYANEGGQYNEVLSFLNKFAKQ